MKKIPVLATIRDAYRFTFTNLGAIIGLIWLPMILMTVIGFFVLQRSYAALADALASGNYATVGPEVLGLICYMIGALLLSTMMSIPVTQLAMGTRKQGALVHFSISTIELRLFRGIMGLLGFLLLPMLLIGVVAGLLETSGSALSAGPGMATVQALSLLFYMACIYFVIRFGVVLPAVAANENGPLLPRAWQLSAGNFWRILAVMMAAALPVLLVSMVIEALVAAPQGPIPSLTSSTAMAAAEFHMMAVELPLSSGISFLIAPILWGLVLGAGASIYRALHETVV